MKNKKINKNIKKIFINKQRALLNNKNRKNNCLYYIKNIYKRYNKPIRGFFIFLFIIILFISNLLKIFESKLEPIKKVCLCLIAKNENKYIIEFIEYYKKYGIDKIFLYDNNDINGEKFEDIIQNYIKSGLVDIIYFKEVKAPQISAYNDCYKKNNFYFDWLIFFDIDEFIYLKNFNNIKLFLADKRFHKCERIQLNYVYHTDNNLLYYDNRNVLERFPEINKNYNKVWERSNIKSIVRGNYKNIQIVNPHYLSLKFKSCNGFGKNINIHHLHTLNIDYEYYYINHYFSKSLEEFIEKIMRTDVFYIKDVKIKKIGQYFKYNKITKEKIEFIENKTKIHLYKFRDKII